MYYVFDTVFWMLDRDQDGAAELLTPLPEVEPHWWDAVPLQTAIPPLTFAVDRRTPMFDSYPVQSPLLLFSLRLVEILRDAGVQFASYPVTLVELDDGLPLAQEYALFHLLEMYPAIDRERSGAEEIALYADILHNPRPFFRPQEIPTVIFVHQKLRDVFERQNITGCIYEALSSVSNLLV